MGFGLYSIPFELKEEVKMRLFKRVSAETRRHKEMSDLQLLYRQLSRLDRDKEGTRTLLEKIHRKGLNSSVDRLSELPRLVVGLSWDV